eukprot:Phypoly_transcript_10498.p1 GENE.Phypoly_transcript_10498~~Phypoly_transcript_10498.p1  ORF type:complete len:376 (+),score=60.16 Phypoly_transcript_10498:119-1246(+)
MKKVIVLGATGSGKSSLCNILAGRRNTFVVSSGVNSQTSSTAIQNASWLGTGEGALIVDTPGLGDSGGNDTRHIYDMVDVLKQLAVANIFIILFNGQTPRYDEPLQSMLNTFVGIFGKGFLRHTILGFSRWGFDAASKRRREHNNFSEQSRRTEFAAKLRQQFELDFDVPSFFYEQWYSVPNPPIPISVPEMGEYTAQIEVLSEFLRNSTNCDMRGLVAIQAEKDRLREAQEKAEADMRKQMEIAEAHKKLAEEQMKIAKEQAKMAADNSEAAREAEKARKFAEETLTNVRNNSIVSFSCEVQEFPQGNKFRRTTGSKTRWHVLGTRDSVWWEEVQKVVHQQRTKTTRGNGKVEFSEWMILYIEDRITDTGMYHE